MLIANPQSFNGVEQPFAAAQQVLNASQQTLIGVKQTIVVVQPMVAALTELYAAHAESYASRAELYAIEKESYADEGKPHVVANEFHLGRTERVGFDFHLLSFTLFVDAQNFCSCRFRLIPILGATSVSSFAGGPEEITQDL